MERGLEPCDSGEKRGKLLASLASEGEGDGRGRRGGGEGLGLRAQGRDASTGEPTLLTGPLLSASSTCRTRKDQ